MAGDLHDISKSIGGLEALMGQVLKGQTELWGGVEAVRHEVEGVKISLTHLTGNVEALTSESAGMKQRLSTLESRMDSLRFFKAKLYGACGVLVFVGSAVSQYLIKAVAAFFSHIPGL